MIRGNDDDNDDDNGRWAYGDLAVPTATVVAPPAPHSVCQFCGQRGREELILPCRNCPTRFAHRTCLDKERVNIHHPDFVVSCSTCQHDFTLLPSRSSQRARRLRFHAYVLRDFFLVFCVLQLILVLLAVLMSVVDQAVAFCLPSCQPHDKHVEEDCVVCPPIKNTFFPSSLSQDHERFTYYLCGLVVFFALMGLFGLCHRCLQGNDTQSFDRPVQVFCCDCGGGRRHHRGTCHCGDCCCYCDVGDCNCNGGGGNGSGDNCGQVGLVLLVLVAVIVIMFAFVGLFVGIVMATALAQRISQRHLYLLDLREIASDYPVANLAEPLEENIPYAEVVSERRNLRHPMLKPIPLHHVESTALLGGHLDEESNLVIDPEESLKAKSQAEWRACVNLLASILGTGLLVMPGACKITGMPTFVALSCLAAYACNLTACYLVRTVGYVAPSAPVMAATVEEDSTYAGLAFHVYGKRGARAVEIGLVFQQFGACVGYIIVIGDIFYPLLQFYLGQGFISENILRNLFLWGLMFPLTMGVKNLGSLSFASALAVGGIGLFCVAVIGNATYLALAPDGVVLRAQLGPQRDMIGPYWFPESPIALLRSLPLVCFAYDMHFNAIPVHEDMKLDVLPPHSSVEAFRIASKRAFSLSFVVTTCMGLAGYETFLNFTHSDILRNFQVSHTYIAPLMNLVRGLFGLGLSLAFPMIVWELRQVLMILSGSHNNFNRLTVGIFVCTTVLVGMVENATTVFSLVGSTVTPTLDYIFPALLFIRSGAADKAGEYYAPRLVLTVGTLLITVSLSTWIYDRLAGV
ncbi:hypothetical protein BASA81_003858 [Batrachochytrium salamandrivorans]|nr:hypothetical protein BASA81_003858 [Batrachochytrium salamandrivorans]